MSFRELIGRIRGEVVTTGIDVGHYAIKLAQIEHKRGEMRLVAADCRVLPPKLVEDNEVRDASLFAEIIQKMLADNFPEGLKGELVIGINWSNGILADRLKLRKQEASLNEAFILDEAGKRSPFNEEGVNLDYEILDVDPMGEQDVLIVAAKANILSAWTRIFVTAGLSPSVLDVDSFAVANAFLNSATDEELKETVALLTIGERRAHITFIRSGKFHSTRTVQNASADSFISQMCRRLGLGQEEVGKILRGEQQDGYNKELFQSALEYSAEEYATSVELALRYFTSTENQDRVSRLFLTGGGASIPGLADFLTRKLDITTECLNPLRNPKTLQVDGGLFGGDEVSQDVLNLMTPAIGLAMRKL